MMELASMKCTLIIALLFLVIQGICGIDGVDGATGVCGKNPSAMGDKVGPCTAAVQSKNVPVSRSCCDQVKSINKQCLCAIILSKEAQILVSSPKSPSPFLNVASLHIVPPATSLEPIQCHEDSNHVCD